MGEKTIRVLRPVELDPVLKDKVYNALKDAIVAMDIYSDDEPPKLDERMLASMLGVSRTPVREALARLEQEGFVKTYPRRGAFVVRKSKAEILEMIHVWAALESMAARLITENAADKEIGKLRKLFTTFCDDGELQTHIDEYSETNIKFHQALISTCGSELIKEETERLFFHMRAIRNRTITERDRAQRSIIDHMHIIEALEKRDTELAERLVRDHTLNLAEHIRKYADYL
ncbi:MAG: GntR family transcriptional regulator [Arenicellales bacterium WSBS_2016_MAG_OTU3]